MEGKHLSYKLAVRGLSVMQAPVLVLSASLALHPLPNVFFVVNSLHKYEMFSKLAS